MFHSTNAERSRKPRRLLKNPNPPAEAVKTFACKISASFRRQTAAARQRYRQAFHQLEAKFLNSSQGEAGLLYAVPNIPANITPTELASAFNDTLTRLCNKAQEIQFSSTSLSPDSSYERDLLDFEHETYPPTSSPPRTTSTPDLLLPELTDSSTVVESRRASPASVDDLLCRHGLDQLQVPLLPTTRKYPMANTSEEPAKAKQAPPDPFDSLKTLSFQDPSPFPLVTKAQTAVKRAIVETRVGVLDTGDKRASRQRALLRKRAGNNLRQATIDNPANDRVVATPTSLPQCLRPGPLNIRGAKLPRPVAGPMPRRTYPPSTVVSSTYIAYQPGRAPLLPVTSTTADTLMEEMTNELDKVLAACRKKPGEEGILEKAASEAHKPDPVPRTLQPIAPLRLSSRTVRTGWETTPQRSLSFKDRLLDASRSAILAAANEAETSELRWFHCRR
jgi:hypothetical protein